MKSVLDPTYWGTEQPTPELARISQAVLDAATEALGEPPSTGGCVTFFTPEEWKARNEVYGCNSRLIICHDGGDFAPLINLDYEQYTLHDKFDEALKRRLPELYIEPCTCWYAALYPTYPKGTEDGK